MSRLELFVGSVVDSRYALLGNRRGIPQTESPVFTVKKGLPRESRRLQEGKIQTLVRNLAPLRRPSRNAWAQRRLEAALANLPHGMCMFDKDRQMVLCNERYAQMYELPSELVEPGTPLEEIVAYREKIGNAPVAFPNYASHDGIEFRSGANSVFEFTLQDGRTIRINHLALSDGGYVATHEDVTEVIEARSARALADARAALVAELERRNRELEAFSYTVSHDLRTPLRAIDGFSHAILDDYADKLDETGKNHLKRIRQAAQRMGELIDDVIHLSRVTRAEMALGRVDLSQMGREIVEALLRQNRDHNVDVVIADDLVAEADRGMMKIVLENLLGNAWKFTRNIPHPLVEFGVKLGGEEVTYFVRDNGAGFDMAYIDKLFRPFQRLHSERDFPGTGIGLATIHRVIDRHGGRVWAEGAVGQGASFFFTLPDLKSSPLRQHAFTA
jgi:signal transduction histidine kinase